MPQLPSVLERHLGARLALLPVAFEAEVAVIPGRRWRCDFACPALRIAVEIEGGTWLRGQLGAEGKPRHGRHSHPLGFTDDCVKYNALAIAGWLVLRFDRTLVLNDQALFTVAQAIAARAPQYAAQLVPFLPR